MGGCLPYVQFREEADGCPIHFEGKNGKYRYFSETTFSRFLERRRQWLGLKRDYKESCDLSKSILQQLVSIANQYGISRVDFVCDRYPAKSIYKKPGKSEKRQRWCRYY